MRFATFVVVLALAGCANPGVVLVSQDVYLLSRTDKGGIFGNASAMKASVIDDANAFARQQGKVAIAVSTHETPLIPGRAFATIDYQFRLVDPNGLEAKGPAAVSAQCKAE